MEKKYGTLDIINIPFQCSKLYASIIALHRVLTGIIPSIQVLATANFLYVVIRVTSGKSNIESIIMPISIIVIIIGYGWIAGQLVKFIEVKLEARLREQFRTNIIEKIAKLQYKHIENQDTWDLIARVSKEPEVQCKNAYIRLLSLMSIVLRIVGLIFILSSQVWWLGLVITIMIVPLVIIAIMGGGASYEANREVTKYKRKYQYLQEVLTSREFVGERSLFKYTDKVNEKWEDYYETARRFQFKTDFKWFTKMKISSLCTAVISILMVLVLLKPVADKLLPVGMFIAIANGIFDIIYIMSWELSGDIDQLAKNREYLKDFTKFVNLENVEGALETPSRDILDMNTLEFKNVSFKYPGTDRYILKNMSFTIEKGMHYAFVGTNGSGKTTITKLITGLYEDFEGDILINGRSIREYNSKVLKSMCSIVYQDFAKYFITIKDNVALGDINNIEEKDQGERIKQALGATDLKEAFENLPKNLNTNLGKIKSDGQDLSGGQWQRIGIARSIMSKATLRILDEPAAALDPISESNLYEGFEDISKGGTTIFISHRLGSTKLAKEIFVIGEGAVIEKGSHEELMAKQGVYADMYDSQRSWYL